MRGTAKLAPVLAALALLGCGSAADRHRAPRPPPTGHPTGTLYLANAAPGQLTVVDVGRRRVYKRHLRELAPGDPPYMIAVLGGRLVVFGHDRTYAYTPGLREPARDLGESWFFVPSASARLPQLMGTRVVLLGRDRQSWRGFAEFVTFRRRVSTPAAAVELAALGPVRRG